MKGNRHIRIDATVVLTRHGYIQRWLLYNATTLYNICRFKSCISKKPTNIAVTKNVVTSIAIQHMLVKNCTPTFSYNILFNKVVIFCANQHQPYNNIFESCIVVYPKTTNTRSCCRVLPPNTTLIVGCCSVGSCCIYPCLLHSFSFSIMVVAICLTSFYSHFA